VARSPEVAAGGHHSRLDSASSEPPAWRAERAGPLNESPRTVAAGVRRSPALRIAHPAKRARFVPKTFRAPVYTQLRIASSRCQSNRACARARVVPVMPWPEGTSSFRPSVFWGFGAPPLWSVVWPNAPETIRHAVAKNPAARDSDRTDRAGLTSAAPSGPKAQSGSTRPAEVVTNGALSPVIGPGGRCGPSPPAGGGGTCLIIATSGRTCFAGGGRSGDRWRQTAIGGPD
jgi:hypothetical protein